MLLRHLRDFHNESVIVGIAEDFSEYPLEIDLDVFFSFRGYLDEGQADLDRLIDEVKVGKTNAKEILKFCNNKNVNFTK